MMTSAERMRRVLELRYLHDVTLEQVGQLMGVTRERVRQIESKALRILRGRPELARKAIELLRKVDSTR